VNFTDCLRAIIPRSYVWGIDYNTDNHKTLDIVINKCKKNLTV